MAKKTKRTKKQSVRKAKRVKTRKRVARAKNARVALRVNSAVKQPFSALHNSFASIMNHFK